MRRQWSIVAVVAFSLAAGAQTIPSGTAASSACPVELTHLNVNSLSIHLTNTSGKPIAGLVFNLAFADATERWKWMHWEYDQNRPLQEFGWNKLIKPAESKKLSWSYDFEHEHGSGVALVLTSILFADGTNWEDDPNRATCTQVWHHKHKKDGFTKPIQLPSRDSIS